MHAECETFNSNSLGRFHFHKTDLGSKDEVYIFRRKKNKNISFICPRGQCRGMTKSVLKIGIILFTINYEYAVYERSQMSLLITTIVRI